MKQILNNISIAIILTLAQYNIALAEQGQSQDELSWFTSATSSLLNRSSIELSKKHASRGIRYANQALDKKLSSGDKLIAYHNLCIGYLASDYPTYANQYCALAFELALSQGPHKAVRIRGAYKLQKNVINTTMQTTLSPIQIITNNILQQNTKTYLAQLTE